MAGERWKAFDTERTRADREAMVDRQLAARGIRDQRVLAAMREIPRHFFVPPPLAARAYEDYPLEIGCGQTISQPYMVATMLELLGLHGPESVLDVGSGSGYMTAVIAMLARQAYGIELQPALLEQAETRLAELGLANVALDIGDGSEGWFEHAPYDRIVVGAAAPSVPDILRKQLTDGGRLVIPVGDRSMQELMLVIRHGGQFEQTGHGNCVFVPLFGAAGWEEPADDEE